MNVTDEHLLAFSSQPFWDISVKWQTELFLDAEIYRVTRYDMMPNTISLNTIPGFGQVGLIFSVCENIPRAYIYGVLAENIMLKQHINHALLIHFRPGIFTKIMGVPSSEIPADGIALDDVIPWSRQYIEMINSVDNETLHINYLSEFLNICFNKLSPVSIGTGSSQKVTGIELSCNIADYMKLNRKLIKVSDLEDEFYYSKRTIENIVIRDIGISPKQLNLQTCLQTSIQVIKSDPQCNISDLSSALQFHDQAHFGKFFKKMTGVTPAQFKKMFYNSNDENND